MPIFNRVSATTYCYQVNFLNNGLHRIEDIAEEPSGKSVNSLFGKTGMERNNYEAHGYPVEFCILQLLETLIASKMIDITLSAC